MRKTRKDRLVIKQEAPLPKNMGINKISGAPAVATNTDAIVTRYNGKGEIDNTLTPEQTVIEAITIGQNTTYRAKKKPLGKLYDPFTVKDNPQNRIDAINKRTALPLFNFRSITTNAFECYIKYMKTGQNSWLIIAEREI